MQEKLGYLRRCMDKRFGAKTRAVFEKATGLGQDDYWDEAYPGGAALPALTNGVDLAVEHGAIIFGWQAHVDHCAGQPGVSDEEIAKRLDSHIEELKRRFPGRHFRILASKSGIDIQEV